MAAPISADVVHAFIQPVVDVVKTFVGLDTKLTGVDMTTQIDPAPSLSVSIQVSGKLAGAVTVVLAADVARMVAGKMFSVSPLEASDPVTCGEAVAELANIVTGNATGKLLEAGYDVEIHPPHIHGESERQLAERTLVVTLHTPAGPIKVLIDVRVAPPSHAA
jgi:CheY-specific phosphatase CheX